MTLPLVVQGDTIGEQAAKINAGLTQQNGAVGFSMTGGVITGWDDIDAMFATPAADTIYSIRGGEYTLTSELYFQDLDNVSIHSYGGDVTINAHILALTDQGAVRFDNCENLSLRGITFRLDLSTSNYGDGQAYTVVLNSDSGIIKDCRFILNSSLTTAQMAAPLHGVAFVLVPYDDEAVRIEDCSFIALTSAGASAAIGQCVATHGAAMETMVEFVRCNFVKSLDRVLAEKEIIEGVTSFKQCFTTAYDEYIASPGLLCERDAKRLTPSDLWPLINGYKDCRSNDQGIQIYSEAESNVSGYYTVFTVRPNAIGTATLAGRLDINGYCYRGNASSALSYGLSIKSTVSDPDELFLYRQSASMSRVVVSGEALHFQIQSNGTGDPVTFTGVVKFTPYRFQTNIPTNGESRGYIEINETAPVAL